tara:strand:+ start:2964 stop:3668 length:705 start_codon:yes stop_codon:yes gene_type:complete
MCVILVPTERHPTKEELIDAENQNPHGAGIAWRDKNGTMNYRKAINARTVMQIIEREKPQIPYIVHFRIASVGAVCKKLTHPFPVNHSVSLKQKWQGKSPLLFHNGTWRDWKTTLLPFSGNKDFPAGGLDDWSDSRAIAYLAHKTNRGIFRFIDEKVAILEKNGVVNMHGKWEKQDTIWYSNTYHIKTYTTHWKGHQKSVIWDKDDKEKDTIWDREWLEYETQKVKDSMGGSLV